MTSINLTTKINLTSLAIDLEQSLLSPAYVIVLRTEIVLLFTILLLIFELIRQFLKRRIAIHINLLVCYTVNINCRVSVLDRTEEPRFGFRSPKNSVRFSFRFQISKEFPGTDNPINVYKN